MHGSVCTINTARVGKSTLLAEGPQVVNYPGSYLRKRTILTVYDQKGRLPPVLWLLFTRFTVWEQRGPSRSWAAFLHPRSKARYTLVLRPFPAVSACYSLLLVWLFRVFLTERWPSLGLYPGVERKRRKVRIYSFDRQKRGLHIPCFLVQQYSL